MPTRTAIARHLATELMTDREQAISQVAAWLVANHRVGQAGYLAQDVAMALADQGYLSGRVVTAHALTKPMRVAIETDIKRRLKVKYLEIDYLVDSEVIGGLRLELPGQTLDDTIARGLKRLVEQATADE